MPLYSADWDLPDDFPPSEYPDIEGVKEAAITSELAFAPDLSPDDVQGMGEPLGKAQRDWLAWYAGHVRGEVTPQDNEHRQRWQKAKTRFMQLPVSPGRASEALGWAINPFNRVTLEERAAIADKIIAYRQQRLARSAEKRAADDSVRSRVLDLLAAQDDLSGIDVSSREDGRYWLNIGDWADREVSLAVQKGLADIVGKDKFTAEPEQGPDGDGWTPVEPGDDDESEKIVMSEDYAAFRKEMDAKLAEAVEDTDMSPSDAQRKAGNYAKGRFRWHGLTIVLENPVGSVRRGVTADGTAWKTTMKDHYGYILGHTSQADGDAVDVFVATPPNWLTEVVFVVNQVNPASGRFDEHKVIIGAVDREQAETVYRRNYQAGWDGLDSIRPMSIAEFEAWLDDGVSKKRASHET